MTCEQALELISASLDGELTLEEQAQLQTHLDSCPSCRALQTELSGIHEACHTALDAEPPAELKVHILSALPAQKAPSKVVYWKRWGAMAAAIAVIALAAWQLPRSFFDHGATETVGMEEIDTVAEEAPACEEAAGDMDEPMLMKADLAPAADTEYASADTAGAADADALPDYVNGPAIEINSVPIQRQAKGSDTSAGGAAAYKIAPAAEGPATFKIAPAAEEPAAEAMIDTPAEAPAFADHRRALIGEGCNEVAEIPAVSGSADIPAEPFETTSEAESDYLLYCGILTLAEYEPDEDYPAESFPGGYKYTLPVDKFYALVNSLEQSGQPYTLRPGLFADTRPGLVIVTGGAE